MQIFMGARALHVKAHSSVMGKNHAPLDAMHEAQADAERQRDAEVKAAREVEDVRWLLGSERGRRIVWRWMERSGVFRMTFNTNAMQMAFSEGNRNLGNQLLAQIMQIQPEAFARMQKENSNE